MPLSQLKMLLASPFFSDLYEMQKATLKAEQRPVSPLLKLKKRINLIDKNEIKPKPLLNGNELIQLGAVPGPSLGRLAKQLYIAQLDMIVTTKEEAKKFAQQRLMKQSKSLND